MIKLLVVSFFVLIPLLIFAQSIQDNQELKDALNLVEIWIESQMAYNNIPGISMAIVYQDEVVWKHAMGFSNLETKTPMQTNTVYSICSISKLFTSIALMQLRDQGKVRLDDPVSKHLTWFNIEQVHPDWMKFTGTYTYDPWGGEVAVVPWKSELKMAYFPSSAPPLNLERLRHIKDNVFVRVRDDGEDGEEIEFIVGKDGKVKSIFQHSNYWKKIK